MHELDDILGRLEALLGPAAGEPAPLEGGITNRNYRVALGGVDYVIRRPGKDTALLGIDRRAERLANEAAASLGIAPPVAAELEDCLVTRFVACRPVDAGELARDIEQMGVALRRFHSLALTLPAHFRVGELLAAYGAIVMGRGGTLPADYAIAVDAAQLIEGALPALAPCPCHNDLLPGNIIRAQGSQALLIVDWEYAAMGDPRFDLGNLSINNDLDEAAEDRLLAAYDGAPPSDARRAGLKAMRALSDAREAAWGVVQDAISELDFDFARYAAEHFERLRATLARAEFGDWLAAAAG